MSSIISLISPKEGIGKTTFILNLAMSLHNLGRDVIVVDANFDNPNVSLYLGSANLDTTLYEALKNNISVRSAAYMHDTGLKIIPLSLSSNPFEKHPNLKETILDLEGTCEIIIIDTPPFSNNNIDQLLEISDHIFLLTKPDFANVVNSLRLLKLFKHKDKLRGVFVNQRHNENFEMSSENIASFLNLPVICDIPFDKNIMFSLKLSSPVVYSHPDSIASMRFAQIAGLLTGQSSTNEKKSFNIFKYFKFL